MRFGYRNLGSNNLDVQPWRIRRLIDATFAGTTCAFYWDEGGVLWVRARNRRVLQYDERGEIWAKPRKSGGSSDLKLAGIPCVDIRRMPGPGMPLVEAGWFYRRFRDGLPDAMRQPIDALVALLYPESVGAPAGGDDFSVDTSMPLTSPVVYGLRPATVRQAVRHEADVDWAALRDSAEKTADGDDLDEYETFEIAMMCQKRWLTEASDRGRGVIALLMQ
ncbi:hypothetical protein ACIBQ1_56485 [Nonomuraea sp. NPDC050153]|uniref:hypothetical protein n=1 Tax=Nonomuraea sp. NPDC050153 TaxID=3364359 RepID=UPI0037A02DE9